MKKKDTQPQSPTPSTDLALVANKIAADGFVTVEALNEAFGETMTNQALAIMHRTHRILREAYREQDGGQRVKGYELADFRFSKAQIAKLPPELGVFVASMTKTPRYTGFQVVRVLCRYTNKVLAGQIDPNNADRRVFDREGDVIMIPAYCPRRMFQDALPLAFDGKPGSLAFRVRWAAVRIEGAKVVTEIFPVPPSANGQGKGLTPTEVLPSGTEFILEAMIPTSELSVEEFVRVIQVAGRFVRLSPGRSAGRGDFEVVKVLGL